MPKQAFPRAGFGVVYKDGSSEIELSEEGMTLQEYYIGQMLIGKDPNDIGNEEIDLYIFVSGIIIKELQKAQQQKEKPSDDIDS